MAVLVFYALLVAGFAVAHRGLRIRAIPLRLATTLAGAAVMVFTACWFSRDLRSAADVLRYGLSAVAVIAAVGIVTGRRPVRCALALLLVFASLAGIFVSFRAEFLGAITISINAGAVVVTFLFILMLIDVRIGAGREADRLWSCGAVVLAAALVVLLLVGVMGHEGRPADAPPEAWFRLAGSAYGADRMDTRLPDPPPDETGAADADSRPLPPYEAEAMRAGQPYRLRPISGRTAHVGWELYTKYTVPFEVASLILTVAVVGAVAIGRQGARGEARGDT